MCPRTSPTQMQMLIFMLLILKQIPLAVVNKYLQHNCLRLNKCFIGEATGCQAWAELCQTPEYWNPIWDVCLLPPGLNKHKNIQTELGMRHAGRMGSAWHGKCCDCWWGGGCSQVPIIKMKAVSPERQELREAWKPPQPAQLNHHYLPGAASCNQITAWENSCQSGTGSEIKTWKVTLQICVNVKGVWWIGVTLRWKHSMWCLENYPV